MATSEQAREILSRFGEVRPQSPRDWLGPFSIPPAIEHFYRDVGPVDIVVESFGNPFYFPSLAKLWEFQAGYRWNGISGEPSADWQDDWLVVAVEGSDPFILSRSSDVVFLDIGGQGRWAPREVFPNLTTMAACLGKLGAIVSDAGENFCDDDCYIRPEWREEMVAALSPLLGSPMLAASLLLSLDWG